MPKKKPDESPSTAVAERDSAVNPLALAEEQFPKAEREAIAKFVNVSADDPAFLPYLGLAAHLGLSPIMGEIWLIKGRRKEGDNWVDFYRPAVGRDGLLKHAREQKAFKGVRYGVVCANDTFEVEDDGWEVKVLHRPASLQPGQAKGHESRYRGAVIGAWAKLYYRDDRPPDYYFAPAHEHVQITTKDGGRDFQGAWSYTSAMIIKSAVSYVCRIGFGVSGIVPFDELRVDDPQMLGEQADGGGEWGGDSGSIGEDPAEANGEYINELDVSDDLKETLTQALLALNELAPFSWTPAKLRMRLGSDADEKKTKEVLAEVEAEFTALRDREVEAEEVADAVQLIRARDLKPPLEVCATVGEEEAEWHVLEDVVFDEEAGVVVCKLAGGKESNFHPTAEVEARTPADDAGEA